MKLSYENIRVTLGGKEILKDVSLSAEDGKMTGIVGPNGCGKSTLIKTTFGICTPSAGRILAGELDVAKLSPKDLASMIGYVGQDGGCVFDFTVYDIVAMSMYARKDRKQTAKDVIEDALNDLGILHLRDRSILSLSGGERKMVFIARAAALGADTLILDEPTNHLDIRHQMFLLDYLKKSGKTVLIVLHDLRLAAHYCDRLYLMSKGQVEAQGEPVEALTESRVQKVFGIRGRAYENESGGLDFSLFS